MSTAIKWNTPRFVLESSLGQALAVELERLGAGKTEIVLTFPNVQMRAEGPSGIFECNACAHRLLRDAIRARDLDHLKRLHGRQSFPAFRDMKTALRAAAASLLSSQRDAQRRELWSGGRRHNPHVVTALAASRAYLAFRTQRKWDRERDAIRPFRESLKAAHGVFAATIRSCDGHVLLHRLSKECTDQIIPIVPMLEKCRTAVTSAKRAGKLARRMEAELRMAAEAEQAIFGP